MIRYKGCSEGTIVFNKRQNKRIEGRSIFRKKKPTNFSEQKFISYFQLYPFQNSNFHLEPSILRLKFLNYPSKLAKTLILQKRLIYA